MASPIFAEEIKLSLDFEFGESGDVIFNRLSDIGTDSDNDIYILDYKEKLIYVFNEAGKFQNTLGRPGQGPGEFQYPTSIYIDSKDIVYVLDRSNRRVEVFDSKNNFSKSINFTDLPIGGGDNIIADENGNLYISGFYRNSDSVLAKFSSAGELQKHFPLPLVEYDGGNFSEHNKMMIKQNLNRGTMCFVDGDRLIFSYAWPYIIKSLTLEGEKPEQFSNPTNLNWTPYIFETEPNGLIQGTSTQSNKIFLINNTYLVNSIYCVDLKGNPKKKIPHKDIPEKLDKHITVKRAFTVLDFYTKNGKFIDSAEIDERIYFFASDAKGRILGIKRDEEGIQTIVRYIAEIVQN
jgi:hypothetical protein